MKTAIKPVKTIVRPANTIKTYLLVAMLFGVSGTHGQTLNTNWKQDMNALLEQFLKCTGESTGNNYQCSAFISESMSKVYKVGNVYAVESKRYKLMNEVSEFIAQPAQWSLMGYAYEQDILNEAQARANAKKAVVAMYVTTEGVKHIALVLPGDLHPSGTWGLKVPNSASFVLNDPSKSYVGKGLSYAFSRSMLKDVKLYSKNY